MNTKMFKVIPTILVAAVFCYLPLYREYVIQSSKGKEQFTKTVTVYKQCGLGKSVLPKYRRTLGYLIFRNVFIPLDLRRRRKR